MSFPTLTTDRLILRQLEPSDENEIFALRSDDRVNEFLDRSKANTIEDARVFIQKINNGMRDNACAYWGLALNDDNKLIGTICLWNISMENSTAEIGYELQPAFQGNGYVHEAIGRVIEYGFEVMKLHTILAELDPANVKSIKILEKNGFKRIVNSGDIEAELRKTIVYSLDREPV